MIARSHRWKPVLVGAGAFVLAGAATFGLTTLLRGSADQSGAAVGAPAPASQIVYAPTEATELVPVFETVDVAVDDELPDGESLDDDAPTPAGPEGDVVDLGETPAAQPRVISYVSVPRSGGSGQQVDVGDDGATTSDGAGDFRSGVMKAAVEDLDVSLWNDVFLDRPNPLTIYYPDLEVLRQVEPAAVDPCSAGAPANEERCPDGLSATVQASSQWLTPQLEIRLVEGRVEPASSTAPFSGCPADTPEPGDGEQIVTLLSTTAVTEYSVSLRRLNSSVVEETVSVEPPSDAYVDEARRGVGAVARCMLVPRDARSAYEVTVNAVDVWNQTREVTSFFGADVRNQRPPTRMWRDEVTNFSGFAQAYSPIDGKVEFRLTTRGPDEAPGECVDGAPMPTFRIGDPPKAAGLYDPAFVKGYVTRFDFVPETTMQVCALIFGSDLSERPDFVDQVEFVAPAVRLPTILLEDITATGDLIRAETYRFETTGEICGNAIGPFPAEDIRFRVRFGEAQPFNAPIWECDEWVALRGTKPWTTPIEVEHLHIDPQTNRGSWTTTRFGLNTQVQLCNGPLWSCAAPPPLRFGLPHSTFDSRNMAGGEVRFRIDSVPFERGAPDGAPSMSHRGSRHFSEIEDRDGAPVVEASQDLILDRFDESTMRNLLSVTARSDVAVTWTGVRIESDSLCVEAYRGPVPSEPAIEFQIDVPACPGTTADVFFQFTDAAGRSYEARSSMWSPQAVGLIRVTGVITNLGDRPLGVTAGDRGGVLTIIDGSDLDSVVRAPGGGPACLQPGESLGAAGRTDFVLNGRPTLAIFGVGAVDDCASGVPGAFQSVAAPFDLLIPGTNQVRETFQTPDGLIEVQIAIDVLPCGVPTGDPESCERWQVQIT